MRIPLAVVAQVDQGEAGTTFDEAAGGEEAAAVDGGFFAVDSVEAIGLRVLGVEVEGLGHGGLHPVGEFVRLDACGELFVVGVLDAGEGVEVSDEGELLALFLGEHALGRGAEGEGGAGVEREFDACVGRAEIVGVEVLTDPHVGILAEENELRQVLIQGAESVVDPGADAGLFRVELVAAVVELELGGVVVVGRIH